MRPFESVRAWLKARRSSARGAQVRLEHRLVISGSACGGAFLLDRPAPTTCEEVLGHGWTAHLTAESPQVVVRGPGHVDSYEETFAESLAASQEALDLVAMRGGPGLAVVSADSEHVVWWTGADGRVVLRVVAVSDLGVSMSATATVTDASGNVRPSPPPPVLVWHPSLRYFRLAQVTGDLFDAYRNMYLALESLLSTIVPPKLSVTGKPAEREGDWLRRALATIDSSLPLAPYAPAGSVPPVDLVFDDIYAGTRTRLFHAKSGRPVLLPHGLDSRHDVIESLERLARLFTDLFAHHTGHRRPSSAMTHAGFEMITSFDATAAVSDDPAQENKADVAINPAGGRSERLPTRRAPELSSPGLAYWLGDCQQAQSIDLGEGLIRRAGLVNDDGVLIQVNRLSEPVSLAGVDVLQVQQGARLVNVQQPRFRFST